MEFGKPAKEDGKGSVRGGKARKSLFGRLGEKYKEGAENDAEIAHCRMHRLKAAGIAAKEAMGQIYGLKDEKHPSEQMQEAEKDHPKLAKWTAKIYKFAYRIGLVGVGMAIKAALGPSVGAIGSAIAYTTALCHPFFVGSIAKFRKHKKEHPAPAEEHAEKERKGLLERIKEKVSPLRALLKPDMSTMVLVSTPFEFLSFGISVGITEKIAALGGRVVTPALAVLGLAAGTIAMYAVEYAGFYILWKKLVLRGVEKGTVKDAVKSFVSEVRERALVRAPAGIKYAVGRAAAYILDHTGLYALGKKLMPKAKEDTAKDALKDFIERSRQKLESVRTAAPKNASEYIGQVFGLSFSYYGFWIQLYRFPAAILLGLGGLSVDMFMGLLVGTLTAAYNIYNCVVWSGWTDSMKKKLKEGNEHLGIDPP